MQDLQIVNMAVEVPLSSLRVKKANQLGFHIDKMIRSVRCASKKVRAIIVSARLGMGKIA